MVFCTMCTFLGCHSASSDKHMDRNYKNPLSFFSISGDFQKKEFEKKDKKQLM